MAKPLTPAQRQDFGSQCYELSLKGVSNREIARQLGVSDKTVSRLVRQEAERRGRERPDFLQHAIDTHRRTIARIWEELDRRDPSPHATSQLAHALTNAQSQLDKITGVLAPSRMDIRMSVSQEYGVQNLSDAALEAVVILTQAGSAGQDGEDALREIVRRYQNNTLAPTFTVDSADLLELVPPEDLHRVENLNELLAQESPEDTYSADED